MSDTKDISYLQLSPSFSGIHSYMQISYSTEPKLVDISKNCATTFTSLLKTSSENGDKHWYCSLLSISISNLFSLYLSYLWTKCVLQDIKQNWSIETLYKRIGYNLNVMRPSAWLVINSIRFENFAALLNCTPMDRASDSMMAPTIS